MAEAGANVSPGFLRGSARVSRASLCILRNEWTFRKKRGTRALPARMAIFPEVEHDENVIDRIAAAQREELEQEIATLQAEADRVAEPGNANVLVGRRAR